MNSKHNNRVTSILRIAKLAKAIAILCSLTLCGLVVQAQNRSFTFTNASPDEGLIIESSTRSGLQVRHTIKQMVLIRINDNGYSGEAIVAGKSISMPADAGKPNLPVESRFVAIPNGATVSYRVLNRSMHILNDVDIMPAAPILADTDNSPNTYEKDHSIYDVDAFYPSSPITVSEPITMRGVQVVAVSVSPYQYNPVSKELRVFDDLQFELSFEGGNGNYGDDRLRSPYWDPILMQNLVNYNQLPTIDYEARMREWSTTRPDGCEYLIVIPNDENFRPYANELKQYRIKQGIITQVKSLAEMGCTTTEQMKEYFHNAYNTWDIAPVAVLLLGDHNTNMAEGIPAQTISHPYSVSCITDNGYADVNNDNLPDMVFSRLVAANASEAQMMVSKQIEYEYTAPNMSPSTYDQPITALGWQTERWFQLCSEVVGGYWRNQGKHPVRINAIFSGTPDTIWSSNSNTPLIVSYFGPQGCGYIPERPDAIGGWTGGTGQQVVDAVNNGAMLLQHRDHGYNQGWGEPSFNTSYVNRLTNVGKMTFVNTINCQTGAFDFSSNCLIEAFMRRTYNGQNAGAVGCIGPTEVSYSFVNDAYAWGLYDHYDPMFMPSYGPFANYEGNWMPAFGNVAGKYFLQQSAWPYNTSDKAITLKMFTAHCDAFLRLYTQVPQSLAVSNPSEINNATTSMTVTATAGATIALSNGEAVIAIAQATGSAQNIYFAPQPAGSLVTIVVTKQDYLRYVDQIQVEAASGYAIFATASPSNAGTITGGGAYEPGETCTLTATAANQYAFVNWTEDGVEVSNQPTYSFTVEGNRILTANFISTTISILASASPSNGGTVEGSGIYTLNDMVTLTAHPNMRYEFAEWKENGVTVSTEATYTFTATGDRTLEAIFARCNYDFAQVCSTGQTLYYSIYPASSQTVKITYPCYNNSNYYSGYERPTGDIEFPSTVTHEGVTYIVNRIGSYAFDQCDGLTGNLCIPNTVTTIESSAFKGCSGFTGTLTLPNSITAIRNSTFKDCSGLTGNLVIPNSVNTIEVYAFYNCSGLTGDLVIPNSVTTLGSCAFYGCNGFTGTLTISNSVTAIENGTFSGCNSFTGNLVIGNSVATIGGSAFFNCIGFTGDLVLPSSLTSIGNSAFFCCSNFRSIISRAVNPPTITQISFTNVPRTIPVTVECGSMEDYQNAPYWSSFTNYREACNHWIPNSAQYEDNMTITCVLQIDGVEQMDGKYELGAFCNDECRGSQRATLFPVTNQFIVQLQVFGNNGDEITFRLYDHDQQVELDRTTLTVLSFSSNGYGSLLNPLVINFFYPAVITAIVNPAEAATVTGAGIYSVGDNVTLTTDANGHYAFVNWTKNGVVVSTSATYQFTATGNADYVANYVFCQSAELTDGWNWWSSYLELSPTNSLSLLEASLGNSATLIKSRSNGFVEYYEYNNTSGWFGTLSTIENEQMYKINTIEACNIAITGAEVIPANHTIDINYGWNWIGYPCGQDLSVDIALADFEPAPNDIIKDRNSFTTYYSGNSNSMWFGTLNTLEAGHGYMYQSHSTTPKTLSIPSQRNNEATPQNITAGGNIHKPAAANYPDNMTVISVVELQGEELYADHYEVAAYANGECRGSAKLMYVEPIDRYVAFLSIFGDHAAELNFVLTDGVATQHSVDMMMYESDACVGTLGQPYVLHFAPTGIGEEGCEEIVAYPNPTQGKLIIEGQGIKRVEVYNAYGQLIASETTSNEHHELNLSDVASGLYMLRVVSSDSIIEKCIVKE